MLNPRSTAVGIFEATPKISRDRDWRWIVSVALRKWWLALAASVLFATLAVVYVALRPISYTAVALVKVYSLVLSSSGENTFFAEAEFEPNFLETQIQSIMADPVSLSALERLGTPLGDVANAQAELVGFKRRLEVSRVGQSSLVAVFFTDADRERAADAANMVVTVYGELLRSNREAAAATAGNWLGDRLREAGPRSQLVAAALPPIEKKGPRGLLVIAAAAIAGGVLGLMLSLVHAVFNPRIRTVNTLELAIGAPCLGIVPVLTNNPVRKSGLEPTVLTTLFLSARSGKPSPAFAAITRHLVPTDRTSRPLLVGVTSALPSEGRTTLAANLAVCAARQGWKTLLVDAAGDAPALTREHLARPADTQPPEATFGGHVAFQPFDTDCRATLEKAILRVDDFEIAFADLPPLLATAELGAGAERLDAIVLVVQQDRVADNELRVLLSLNPGVRERLVGGVLNRVSYARVERFLLPEASVVEKLRCFDARKTRA